MAARRGMARSRGIAVRRNLAKSRCSFNLSLHTRHSQWDSHPPYQIKRRPSLLHHCRSFLCWCFFSFSHSHAHAHSHHLISDIRPCIDLTQPLWLNSWFHRAPTPDRTTCDTTASAIKPPEEKQLCSAHSLTISLYPRWILRRNHGPLLGQVHDRAICDHDTWHSFVLEYCTFSIYRNTNSHTRALLIHSFSIDENRRAHSCRRKNAYVTQQQQAIAILVFESTTTSNPSPDSFPLPPPPHPHPRPHSFDLDNNPNSIRAVDTPQADTDSCRLNTID